MYSFLFIFFYAYYLFLLYMLCPPPPIFVSYRHVACRVEGAHAFDFRRAGTIVKIARQKHKGIFIRSTVVEGTGDTFVIKLFFFFQTRLETKKSQKSVQHFLKREKRLRFIGNT